VEYNNVPLFAEHKDPFDRLIIATAIHQKLDVITVDTQFNNYRDLVNIIW
jgi:PIN domain nuclease of toxin-antitoxin system